MTLLAAVWLFKVFSMNFKMNKFIIPFLSFSGHTVAATLFGNGFTEAAHLV